MDFRDAVLRAARFAAKKTAEQGYLRAVRLLPPLDGQPARVCATDGVMGCVLAVTEPAELPNALVPVDPLVGAMAPEGRQLQRFTQDEKSLELITTHPRRTGVAEVYTYRIPTQAFGSYPPPPMLPEDGVFQFVPEWSTVLKVRHAVAGAATDNAAYRCVHFYGAGVEATDRTRLARVALEGGWQGLVPGALFGGWPKGGVEVAFRGTHAFFRIARTEVRYAVLQAGSFKESRNLLPEEHLGPTAVVPVAALQAAVKAAVKLASAKTVELRFSAGELFLQSWGLNPHKKFQTAIPIVGGATPLRILLHGPNFVAALRTIDTPRVLVGYTTNTEPLRIESGRLTLGLWPLLETQEVI